ncbi:MAG: hypothetical protein FJ137_11350 [Deltaproteobacteria bacterium]|nr:hypothetical protein [Deltaproteobacteria bacterium]
MTAQDCNDTNAASTTRATDADCDGELDTHRIALHAQLQSEVCTSFTLARARTFRLETGEADSLACPGDTILELRSSGGDFITSDDDGGNSVCSLIVRTQQAAGTYQACVRPFDSPVFGVGVWLTLE